MKKPIFSAIPDVALYSASIGASLCTARKLRGMTQGSVATRIGATREVVINAEKGKSVTTQNLLSMLWLYGLLPQLSESIATKNDRVGLSMAIHKLPQRVKSRTDNDF